MTLYGRVAVALVVGMVYSDAYSPVSIIRQSRNGRPLRQQSGWVTKPTTGLLSRPTALWSTQTLEPVSPLEEETTKPKQAPPLDKVALARYFVGTSLQWGAIYAFLFAIEAAFTRMALKPAATVWFARVFFAFMSLRSRVFSVLDNSRPKVKDERQQIADRKRPSWMPPPRAFPVIWTTIGLLRTVSSSLVYEATGSLLAPPLMLFMLHLCIGDTWNTINNVERRTGTAVPGVFTVWLSVVASVVAYYKVLPAAGLVLLPSAVWISVANVLVFTIWKLNGREPMYPFKRS